METRIFSTKENLSWNFREPSPLQSVKGKRMQMNSQENLDLTSIAHELSP